MLDHAFEEYDEMLEREARDDLAEWASFFNARGDDRLEPSPWDSDVPVLSSSTPASRYRVLPADEGCTGRGPRSLWRRAGDVAASTLRPSPVSLPPARPGLQPSMGPGRV
jgi:hypothetical protein